MLYSYTNINAHLSTKPVQSKHSTQPSLNPPDPLQSSHNWLNSHFFGKPFAISFEQQNNY